MSIIIPILKTVTGLWTTDFRKRKYPLILVPGLVVLRLCLPSSECCLVTSDEKCGGRSVREFKESSVKGWMFSLIWWIGKGGPPCSCLLVCPIPPPTSYPVFHEVRGIFGTVPLTSIGRDWKYGCLCMSCLVCLSGVDGLWSGEDVRGVSDFGVRWSPCSLIHRFFLRLFI